MSIVAEVVEYLRETGRGEAAKQLQEWADHLMGVLPDDTVCACLSETGGRKVRLYERCLRCGAFMEADYLADELDRGESVKRIGAE